MKFKKAIITGITGQDGSYLAEFLLKKKYIVHGIKRRSSSFNTSRIDHIYENKNYKNRFFLHYGDLLDPNSLTDLISKIKPQEIYNFAAQSHVGVSFMLPNYTSQVNSLGTLNLLHAIYDCGLANKTKFYQASTSELYGEIQESKQSEKTKFYPKSPYATSKLFAYWITKNYRESYGMFASNGILFNHESPRRGETFVTRKITRGLSRINTGIEKCIYMGNLDAKRDWGHAKDYVYMQWLMLQQENPEDFVIATGEMKTVREFIEISSAKLGWNKVNDGPAIIWEGSGVNEIGRRADNNEIVIRIDERYFRPTEVNELLGDPSKAKTKLNWQPKISLDELITEMIHADTKEAEKEAMLQKQGFEIYGAIESPPSKP